ncbi:hypothetical protein PQQ73_02175 [Paraburkholderia strydomiana]|uniref:MFS transporter n=1 Tax=Paraburkholderia strydomiana TaxID=1245417 RepID=A0ABW9E7Y4_9BURK
MSEFAWQGSKDGGFCQYAMYSWRDRDRALRKERLLRGYPALLAIGGSARYGALTWPLPAIGLPARLITPATTAALMACVDGSRAGIAAGVLNAARQTGAALGVALSGALIAMRPSTAEGMRASLLIAAVMRRSPPWCGGARRRNRAFPQAKSIPPGASCPSEEPGERAKERIRTLAVRSSLASLHTIISSSIKHELRALLHLPFLLISRK